MLDTRYFTNLEESSQLKSRCSHYRDLNEILRDLQVRLENSPKIIYSINLRRRNSEENRIFNFMHVIFVFSINLTTADLVV